MSGPALRHGVEILGSRRDAIALREQWNVAVEKHAGHLHGPDVTSTFEWTNTLWEQRIDDADSRLVTSWKEGALDAVLPLYRERITLRGLPCRRLFPIHELYSGRSGIVSLGDKVQAADAMLGSLVRAGGWDVLDISVVEGSSSQNAVREAARQHRLRTEVEMLDATPYIVLDEGWDDFFAGLPKKLRYTIRSSAKRLASMGKVTHRTVRASEEMPVFLEDLMDIEQHSWKEESGTSITTNPHQEAFYRQLLTDAARAGWLSAHVMYLDGQPIAYLCGLEFAGVFYDLKESYRADLRDQSPGHVLKTYVLPYLMDRGISWYDFRGVCDGYKLRWTDMTYRRVRYRLFAPGARTALIAGSARSCDAFGGPSESGASSANPMPRPIPMAGIAVASTAFLPPAHPRAEWPGLGLRGTTNLVKQARKRGKLKFCFKGRGAIHRLALALPAALGDTVLVPAFHCPTMVEPLLAAGRRVRFYDVDADLVPDAASLAAAMGSDVAAVLVTRFFGFSPPLEPVMELLRAQGAVVVEDCAHSFLCANPLRLAGEQADAAVYSFWKLVPSMAGGGVMLNDTRLDLPAPRSLPVGTWLCYLREFAGELREGRWHASTDTTASGDEDALIVPEVAPSYPTLSNYPFDEVVGRGNCPWPSRQVIEHANLADVCARRRRNFLVALETLAGVAGVEPVFGELPDDVCPWAFPVLIGERNDTDYRLRARGVPLFTFGETAHPALDDAAAFPVSDHYRRQMIALAIHQQLEPEQVHRYCEVIRRFVERRARS